MSSSQLSSSGKRVAVLGATGAVGIEFLKVLERRSFPIKELRLLASPRSAGTSLFFQGEKIPVDVLRRESFRGIDLAFFSAGGEISKQFAPAALDAGALVIDNSSAFRMDPTVPLVIPEINAHQINNHRGIIANPNCSTAIALMALYPLHQQFQLRRVIASTYQAVSGAGAMGMEELETQILDSTEKRPLISKHFKHQIAFNLIPQIDSFLENGYTREEMKLQNESRRILNLPDLQVSVTCVRVPVYRAHSLAIHASFQQPVSLSKAQDALLSAPGVDLLDNPSESLYPMPLYAQESDCCHVGRLRLEQGNPYGLAFWVCGDQLLKGAALNAVQIAECL